MGSDSSPTDPSDVTAVWEEYNSGWEENEDIRVECNSAAPTATRAPTASTAPTATPSVTSAPSESCLDVVTRIH